MLLPRSKEQSVHALTVIATVIPMAAGVILSAVFMLDLVA